MKKINKLAVAMTMIGALLMLVSTVSAAKLGEGWTIAGYNAGWVLLLGGIVVAALFGYTKILKAKPKMAATVIGILMVFGGIAFLAVDIEDSAASTTTTSPVSDWNVEAHDITASGWITGTGTWDDEDDPNQITLQLNHDNGGANYNSYDELVFVANFSVDPSAGEGADTTDLVTIHYKTDYDMKYFGEYVLDKSANNFLANWTTAAGTTYYDGSIDMQLTDTKYMQAAYTIDGGNETVGEYLDAVGDSVSWTITMWDDFGWQRTFTVTGIVITNAA